MSDMPPWEPIDNGTDQTEVNSKTKICPFSMNNGEVGPIGCMEDMCMAWTKGSEEYGIKAHCLLI
jgi:hypothetical protein